MADGERARVPFGSPTPGWDTGIPGLSRGRSAVLEDTGEAPNLPQAESQLPFGMILSFLLCVILPTIAAAIYFFFIASNQYQSEFRFAISQGSSAVPGAPPPGSSSSGTVASQLASALPALTGSQGATMAQAQNYVVVDYIQSLQAVQDVSKRVNLRAVYDRPGVDVLARFDKRKKDEFLLKYWNKMVKAEYDPISGLATVDVKAFTPQDANLVASSLVSASEDLVNNLVNKPNLDAVKSAEQQVRDSQQKVQAVRAQLAAYRHNSGAIDPTQSLVPANIQLVETLRPNVAQLESQLSAMRAQGMGNSPAAALTIDRLTATKRQLAQVQGEVNHGGGGSAAPLTSVVGSFEKINFDVQFEQSLLDSALQTLAQTRAYALQQHMYLIPYVSPSPAQAAMYPERLQSTMLAAILLFCAWVAGALVFKAVEQHMD